MTMLEKISAAYGCVDPDRCPPEIPRGSCDDCLAAARAAVEAMMEPSEAMVGAGQEGGYAAEIEGREASSTSETYRAMLQAILDEKP